jgi:hypothetical protein
LPHGSTTTADRTPFGAMMVRVNDGVVSRSCITDACMPIPRHRAVGVPHRAHTAQSWSRVERRATHASPLPVGIMARRGAMIPQTMPGKDLRARGNRDGAPIASPADPHPGVRCHRRIGDFGAPHAARIDDDSPIAPRSAR